MPPSPAPSWTADTAARSRLAFMGGQPTRLELRRTDHAHGPGARISGDAARGEGEAGRGGGGRAARRAGGGLDREQGWPWPARDPRRAACRAGGPARRLVVYRQRAADVAAASGEPARAGA